MDNCLNGFNSCIFAYGQTGAGKTWAPAPPHPLFLLFFLEGASPCRPRSKPLGVQNRRCVYRSFYGVRGPLSAERSEATCATHQATWLPLNWLLRQWELPFDWWVSCAGVDCGGVLHLSVSPRRCRRMRVHLSASVLFSGG